MQYVETGIDDHARGRLRPLLEVRTIDGHGPLGLAQWQVDGRGRDASVGKTVDVALHGTGLAGGAVGDEDVHRCRVVEAVTR